MDPTECLTAILAIAERIMEAYDDDEALGEAFAAEADTLAEKVADLDTWLREGGALPAQWLVCTCGGYDSAHATTCARYGRDHEEHRR